MATIESLPRPLLILTLAVILAIVAIFVFRLATAKRVNVSVKKDGASVELGSGDENSAGSSTQEGIHHVSIKTAEVRQSVQNIHVGHSHSDPTKKK